MLLPPKPLQPDFKQYQQQVVENAKTMVEVVKQRGLKVVSNGTDNHLFLVDFIEKGLTGKAVDAALGAANITVNMNAVPNDPQSPFVTSGIRIGTPAITTRGFGTAESTDLANWMCDIIDNLDDQSVINSTREKVTEVCKRFPVYEY